MTSKALVRAVTQYEVLVESEVTAQVRGHMWFTDDEVREFCELDDDEAITYRHIEEYALEHADGECDYELDNIDDYQSTTVTTLHTAKKMQVPASFVPLPGLEGKL